MAMWVLTRNRPTGPRRGTTVLVLGAASVALGAGAAAGLTILALATGGSVACMIPGVVASIGALG